jgi:hypothetical protein
MENDQSVIIRFLCKERVSPEDFHTRLEAQFRDAIYSKRSVRRWYQYVRQRHEDLHGELRSVSPTIDFLDIRILALLEKHPFHSASSIVEALCVSHSIILSHLRESLGNFLYTLDPAPVNNQFVTNSDGDLPRVIAHSQGSRNK